MNSTRECTTLWGCTTTWIRSGPTPKSQCASITSSPLFIRVAESIVILGPIFHVGWPQRLLRCHALQLPPECVRGTGPPDAVSQSRRTSSIFSPRRHWCNALCSLSTGRIRRHGLSAQRRVMCSPATTRASLLARATSRPQAEAPYVGRHQSRPRPTSALTTRSTPSCVATSTRPSGPWTTRAGGVDAALQLRRESRRRARWPRWSGRKRRTCCSSRSRLVPGGQGDAPRSGPRTSLDDVEGADPDRPGGAEDGQLLHVADPCRNHDVVIVEDRCRTSSRLSVRSSIPPCPGKQARGVLDPAGPLEHALRQIPQNRRGQPEDQPSGTSACHSASRCRTRNGPPGPRARWRPSRPGAPSQLLLGDRQRRHAMPTDRAVPT